MQSDYLKIDIKEIAVFNISHKNIKQFSKSGILNFLIKIYRLSN
jgi:hypothetical protein